MAAKKNSLYKEKLFLINDDLGNGAGFLALLPTKETVPSKWRSDLADMKGFVPADWPWIFNAIKGGKGYDYKLDLGNPNAELYSFWLENWFENSKIFKEYQGPKGLMSMPPSVGYDLLTKLNKYFIEPFFAAKSEFNPNGQTFWDLSTQMGIPYDLSIIPDVTAPEKIMAALKKDDDPNLSAEEIDAAVYAGQIGQANFFKVRSFFNRNISNDPFSRFSNLAAYRHAVTEKVYVPSMYEMVYQNYKDDAELNLSVYRDSSGNVERTAFLDLEAYKYFLSACSAMGGGNLKEVGRYLNTDEGVDRLGDFAKGILGVANLDYVETFFQEKEGFHTVNSIESLKKLVTGAGGSAAYGEAPQSRRYYRRKWEGSGATEEYRAQGRGIISFGADDMLPMYVKTEFSAEKNNFLSFLNSSSNQLAEYNNFSEFLNSPAIQPFFTQLLSFYVDSHSSTPKVQWKGKPWLESKKLAFYDESKSLVEQAGSTVIDLQKALGDIDFFNFDLYTGSEFKAQQKGVQACSTFTKKLSFLLFKNRVNDLLGALLPQGGKVPMIAPKYEETICYRIVKTDYSAKADGSVKQEWYVPNFPGLNMVELFDNQVAFGGNAEYRVYALKIIVGLNYHYAPDLTAYGGTADIPKGTKPRSPRSIGFDDPTWNKYSMSYGKDASVGEKCGVPVGVKSENHFHADNTTNYGTGDTGWLSWNGNTATALAFKTPQDKYTFFAYHHLGGNKPTKYEKLFGLQDYPLKIKGDWAGGTCGDEIDGSTEFTSGDYQYLVVVEPRLVLTEVPYFTKTPVIADTYPVAPDLKIYPRKGVDNKVALWFEALNDEYAAKFISAGFGTTVEAAKNQSAMIYSRYHHRLKKDELYFNSEEDDVRYFELYRLETPPTSWEDFNGAKITRIRRGAISPSGETSTNSYALFSPDPEAPFKIDAIGGSVDDYISPNQSYYYMLRAYDVSGQPSNPSTIYHVHIINDEGYINPTIEPYDMELAREGHEMVTAQPPFKKIISLGVAGKYSAPPLLDVINGRMIPGGSSDQANDLGVWERTFKVRIKSLKTNKMVDVNIYFDYTTETIKSLAELPNDPRIVEVDVDAMETSDGGSA